MTGSQQHILEKKIVDRRSKIRAFQYVVLSLFGVAGLAWFGTAPIHYAYSLKSAFVLGVMAGLIGMMLSYRVLEYAVQEDLIEVSEE